MPRYPAGEHDFAGRIKNAQHGLSARPTTALQVVAICRSGSFKFARENDRAERDHNRRQYGEYRKRSERLKRVR
jgi:hypothetical protein